MKTYCIDIDGTICTNTDGAYEEARPFLDRIAAINKLYDSGAKIVMFTARGSTTGLNWRKLTEHQLERWGLKYHELHLGKPFADLYIDDKGVNSEEFPW
jgi:dTDP-glucose 4,6-dehydratase